MWSREFLIDRMHGGMNVRFFFFWGHTPKQIDRVDAACLSQWYPRSFAADGDVYRTAEHFMMAAKARLFDDAVALEKILDAKTPADAKAIGRTVRNYDDDKWSAERFSAVVRGNVLKFKAHDDMRAFLLNTGDAVLVEASPRDRIWGIGMGKSNPAASDPTRWRGRNLLGFALMEARALLE